MSFHEGRFLNELQKTLITSKTPANHQTITQFEKSVLSNMSEILETVKDLRKENKDLRDKLNK